MPLSDKETLKLANQFHDEPNFFSACAFLSIDVNELTTQILQKKFKEIFFKYHPDKYKGSDLNSDEIKFIAQNIGNAKEFIKKSPLFKPTEGKPNTKHTRIPTHPYHQYPPHMHNILASLDEKLYDVIFDEPLEEPLPSNLLFNFPREQCLITYDQNGHAIRLRIYKTAELARQAQANESQHPIALSPSIEDSTASETTIIPSLQNCYGTFYPNGEPSSPSEQAVVDYDAVCTNLYNEVLEKAKNIINETEKQQIIEKANMILLKQPNKEEEERLKGVLKEIDDCSRLQIPENHNKVTPISRP